MRVAQAPGGCSTMNERIPLLQKKIQSGTRYTNVSKEHQTWRTSIR